jgi:Cu/Ag efflux pump CusA
MGPEIVKPEPHSQIILGGLVTATFLNLFVVPSLYLRFGKGRERLVTSI